MGQIVLNLSNETIKEMQQVYKNRLKSPPNGAIFSAKTEASTITAYKSGKVLFQGKQPELEANKWGGSSQSNSKAGKKKANTLHAYHPEPRLFTSSHIGSDEAGTGDYFGPITVAAAFVRAEQIPLLKELGVKDSKNLTDSTIQSIATKIVQMNMPYSLVILHNPKYNALQEKGWSQGKMKTMLHHHAIQRLLKKMAPEKPDGILIDQFSEPHVYKNHLKSENQHLTENTYFMTKAESYSIAVAAGSIIARASFVKEMDKLSHKAGIELPKGASNKVDRVAATLIQQNDLAYLHNFAKTHFANTKKAMMLT